MMNAYLYRKMTQELIFNRVSYAVNFCLFSRAFGSYTMVAPDVKLV